MFEFLIRQEKPGLLELCVRCRICRDIVKAIQTYRDVPVDGRPITASQDLHVCSGVTVAEG